MTVLADGRAARASRSRLLWVVLVISLAVNAFFIGTAAWWATSLHMLTPAQRFRQIVHELSLSDDQRDAFQQFTIAARRGMRQLHDSNGPLLQKVWQELAKPQPDQDLIAKLVDQATENRRAYQRTMTAALSQFLADLSPDQRAQFIALTERHHDPAAWRLRRLVTP
ncbi:MAG TPA: Spy/CpxP family protein refolding chaperone [Stellaceae bacterium]|nr:Spy/CpxP family protein refolding chaperone [Stellaceae bacterium]